MPLARRGCLAALAHRPNTTAAAVAGQLGSPRTVGCTSNTVGGPTLNEYVARFLGHVRQAGHGGRDDLGGQPRRFGSVSPTTASPMMSRLP
jgi:hypothetical protein